MSYSLSIDGGAEVSAESLGVQLRQRQRFSLKTDVLTMSFPRGLAGPVALQPDQWVRVFQDGQPIFYGRVPRSTFRLGVTGSMALALQGPWEMLERWPALRDFNSDYAGTWGVPAFVSSGALSNTWALFRSNAFVSGPAPTGYQALFALAGPEFINGGGTGSAGTHFTVGPMPAGETPPNDQTVVALRVADVLRECAKWTPHVSFWWDYDTMPPTLRAMPAEEMVLSGGVNLYWCALNRTLVTGPGSAPPRWELDYYVHSEYETPETVQLGAAVQIIAAEASVRWDMVPSALVVKGNSTTVWPSGSATNAPAVTWLERSSGSPPSRLVEYLFKSLSTPRLEASLTLRAANGRLWASARPGRVWDIQGDDAATGRGVAKAITQSVTDDLLTGITTCDLGLARQLGVGELLSLSRWAKSLSDA